MRLVDWRRTGTDVLRPLYDEGTRRWREILGWDPAGALRQVEQARTTWGLPGFLAVDDAGRIRGWTYFLPQDGLLQVGAVSADTPDATAALIDGTLLAGEAYGSESISCFVFDEAPGVEPALATRGFELEPFLYQTRYLQTVRSSGRWEFAPWNDDDITAAAHLLWRAYPADAGRHLAPGGTRRAWERYLANLVQQTGLGVFNPAASRLFRSGGELAGAALVTTLSPATMHVAQLVVDPAHRRSGLAARLLEEACEIGALQGFRSVSLLVGTGNAAARRVYERRGFVARARFLAARLVSPSGPRASALSA